MLFVKFYSTYQFGSAPSRVSFFANKKGCYQDGINFMAMMYLKGIH